MGLFIVEDIRDHAREPGYGFGVMRLAVGIFNKWRRKDGRLFPVPRMPLTSVGTTSWNTRTPIESGVKL